LLYNYATFTSMHRKTNLYMICEIIKVTEKMKNANKVSFMSIF